MAQYPGLRLTRPIRFLDRAAAGWPPGPSPALVQQGLAQVHQLDLELRQGLVRPGDFRGLREAVLDQGTLQVGDGGEGLALPGRHLRAEPGM